MLATALVSAWLTASGVAMADEAAPAAKEPAAKTAPFQPLPGEVEPPLYHLPDKDGKLQLVPGFSFDDFRQLFELKNQLAQQTRPPAFTIQSLSLTGTADRQRAEIEAQYQITVHESGWVGVPLRLNDAVLTAIEGYEGPGDHFVHYEPQGRGYVAWIRSDAEKTHRVLLKLLTGLVTAGPESHLQLNVPRDVTRSQLKLAVPLPRAVAKVSDGGTLESSLPEGEKTELNVVGLGGALDVAWHAAEAQVAGLPTALEVSAAVQVRINGRNVSSDAKLNVRSLGGEFDRFQVRLPPGAELADAAQSGVTLVPLEATSPKGKLYEVKLEKKTPGPVNVRLVTDRAHTSPQAGDAIELAGFEVLGAVRQWGTLTVQIEGNWQIQWGHSNQSRVDELSGPLRPDDRTAAFEYFVQPYSLTARVVPQKTRIRVEPEYVLLIGSGECQLRARLKYTIRGAKVRSLEVDLSGWEVDNVGPATLVDVDALAPSQNHPFTIPLLQASSGELELTLEAHQRMAPDAGRVALDLPRPQSEATAAANVAVVPADNVELVLQPEETRALAPQAAKPQIKLPDGQQDPLYFRTEGSESRLVATLKVHEQSISAALTTQLDVDERQTRVSQRMAFQIAYQPADQLTLAVPRGVRPDRLNITLDGQRLVPTVLRERTESDAELIPLRVALPAPRIGRCELEISYLAPHEKPLSTANATVKIPLVIPGEGQLTANELVVPRKNSVVASYAKSAKGEWTEDARSRPATDTPDLTLSARRAIAEVALLLRSTERPTAGATTIQRAWIQTRLTDGQRQDRVLYLCSTSESRLQVTLPAEAEMASLEVSVDGRHVTPEVVRQQDATIVMPSPARGEYLVELDYHFAARPPAGALALESPHIKSAAWVRQLYWQVDLPGTEHLISAPDHFTREFSWVWSDYLWRRRSSLETRELEAWIGQPERGDAAAMRETPDVVEQRQTTASNASNRYLFSTVGTVEPLEIYTLSRARLVLWASLPLLIAGLLLIYFPTARHPGLLFAVAVLLAAGTLFDPELALLVAQASALGLVLTALAALLSHSGVRSPTPSTVAVRGSSMSLGERSATELYLRGPSSPSPASTSTEPLVPSLSPEGEP